MYGNASTYSLPFLLVRVGYIWIVVRWNTDGSVRWDRAMDNFFLISDGVVVVVLVVVVLGLIFF